MIRIIESPREAMQGLQQLIPTEAKVKYINALLQAGFDTVETGSYVSPKLIPQMADSLEVLAQLDTRDTNSNIMFLAVSTKGAEAIATSTAVTHISYPFSISPAFLKKNLNTSTEGSLETVSRIAEICQQTGKSPVIYISLAFGNNFRDPWSLEILEQGVVQLYERGIRTIPLSNVSIEINSEQIRSVYSYLIPRFPEIEFGLHLHTSNRDFREKVQAAWDAGVRRFDTVMNGLGGCPLAEDELLGNLSTQNMLTWLHEKSIPHHLDLSRVGLHMF